MNNISFADKIKIKYINETLENAVKVDYSELTSKDGLFSCLYKDLNSLEISGYPTASDYVDRYGKAYNVEEFSALSEEEQKNCALRFYFLPKTQELYLGSTGSGKTTGCVEPQLRAISSQKNKPNLFITDPKGELFDKNAEHLEKQGYKLFILNFKDATRSDKWNPLYELYDKMQEIKYIGATAEVSKGRLKDGLRLVADKSEYKKAYIEYEGVAFPNVELFEEYKMYRVDCLEAEIDSLLNQFANTMIPVQNLKDPSWEYGAQDLLKGLLYCMLEDSIDKDSGFTREMMTYRTIQKYYQALKLPIVDGDISLNAHPLLKNKSKKTISLLATVLSNAPVTRRCFCGTFDCSMKDWFQGHIFALTTNNTINLSETKDKPFAIFLITRDYEKSDFLIAGLFIDWVYRQMLQQAERGEQKRPLHFLLDEFGNIPKIKDFENKISTARSRDIWFHLVLQSYSQLEAIYNKDTAQIIKDNCSQIFLGSTNSDTKEAFSRSCGKHAVETLSSMLNPKETTLTEVPLIPVSRLNELKAGQMYTIRDKMPVIFSQYVRSYICADQGAFADRKYAHGLENNTPTIIESFSHPKFNYSKLDENFASGSFDDLF